MAIFSNNKKAGLLKWLSDHEFKNMDLDLLLTAFTHPSFKGMGFTHPSFKGMGFSRNFN